MVRCNNINKVEYVVQGAGDDERYVVDAKLVRWIVDGCKNLRVLIVMERATCCTCECECYIESEIEDSPCSHLDVEVYLGVEGREVESKDFRGGPQFVWEASEGKPLVWSNEVLDVGSF